MPEPAPLGDRPAGIRLHRIARTLVRKLRPVVIVLQVVYYAVRVVRELMD